MKRLIPRNTVWNWLPFVPSTNSASIHASFWDPALVGGVVPREASFFAKKELYSLWFIKYFLLFWYLQICFNLFYTGRDSTQPTSSKPLSMGSEKKVLHGCCCRVLIKVMFHSIGNKDDSYRRAMK